MIKETSTKNRAGDAELNPCLEDTQHGGHTKRWTNKHVHRHTWVNKELLCNEKRIEINSIVFFIYTNRVESIR